MVATVNDPMEYGPVPADVRHAVDRLVQAHGYATPLENMAGVVGWNAKWEASDNRAKCERAAQLLAEAARLLAEVEADAGVEE